MNKKLKIASVMGICFAFLAVTLSVGFVVWAILNPILTLGGNINFTAKNVNATISAGQLSSTGTIEDSSSKMQEVIFNADNDGSGTIDTWSGLALTFNNAGDDVTITFTITNNSTEASLAVEVSVDADEITNASITLTADGSTISSGSTQTIDPNDAYVTYVITFSVTDKDKNANISNFRINFDLSVAEEQTLTINLLEYAASGEWDSFYVDVNGTTVMSPGLGPIDRQTYTYTTTFYGSLTVSFYGEYYESEETISALAAAAQEGSTITVTSDTGYSEVLTYTDSRGTTDKKITFTITESTTFTCVYYYELVAE